MPLRAFIAALVLAVACGAAVAADVVGYSEAFDTLYRVDLTTRTAQEIGRATPPGTTRYPILDGLTFSPDGRLYAIADAHGPKILLQINSGTGLASPVGSIDTGSNQSQDLSLAFTADGRLWMTTVTGDLWQVDPVTAAASPVGNLGIKVTGLTSRGNVLYGAGGQGNNNLYVIDPATAHATLVGAYGSNIAYVSVASPAFDASGQLWVMLDYVPPPSDNSTVPEWSDLAAGNLSGTLQNRGQVTATPNTSSFADLQYIGLRGFAITAPTGSAAVVSTPALSWVGLAVLILCLGFAAGTRLQRRRPSV